MEVDPLEVPPPPDEDDPEPVPDELPWPEEEDPPDDDAPTVKETLVLDEGISWPLVRSSAVRVVGPVEFTVMVSFRKVKMPISVPFTDSSTCPVPGWSPLLGATN